MFSSQKLLQSSVILRATVAMTGPVIVPLLGTVRIRPLSLNGNTQGGRDSSKIHLLL